MLWLPEPRASITRGVCGGPTRVLLRWWTIQLEYGLGVEAMMPQRPGSEDCVEAEPAWCSCGGIFFCPSVLFSSATKKEVLPGGFLWKIDGYSKYVCCITAPCVMNKYCLNQLQTSTSNFNFKLQLQTSTSNFNFKLQLQTLTSNFNCKLQL